MIFALASPTTLIISSVDASLMRFTLLNSFSRVFLVFSPIPFISSKAEATCKEHHLKVILETGALKTAANIKKASILSMYAGADFIKTSTGKQQPAATPEAAYVMCQAIKEYHALTGNKIGFKPAGGINCVNDALIYYTIVKEVLGEEWLNNELFRLGTSHLAEGELFAGTFSSIILATSAATSASFKLVLYFAKAASYLFWVDSLFSMIR